MSSTSEARSKPPTAASAVYITAKLQRSGRAQKKYQVTLSQVSGVSGVSGVSPQIIHFGHPDYEDFTKHGDEQRKKNYIARHKKREHWNDPFNAGFWARWLLWEKPSMEEAKKNITRVFGIKFI